MYSCQKYTIKIKIYNTFACWVTKVISRTLITFVPRVANLTIALSVGIALQCGRAIAIATANYFKKTQKIEFE